MSMQVITMYTILHMSGIVKSVASKAGKEGEVSWLPRPPTFLQEPPLIPFKNPHVKNRCQAYNV